MENNNNGYNALNASQSSSIRNCRKQPDRSEEHKESKRRLDQMHS